jgi:DNA-binding MarR family transcriptional regulator
VAPASSSARFYRAASYKSEDSVGYLMKRVIGSIVHQVDRRLEVHGLTSAQWGPLLHLHKMGRTPVAELARGMQVDAGAMTRLLDRLEKKRLCRRARCTEDRRVVQVEITPEGEASIAAVPAVLAEVLNAHLAGFSADEWQTLKGYLLRMLATGEALREAEDREGAAAP